MARSRKRRGKGEQQVFDFKSWGGPRPGSGRKPKGERAGVSHKHREPVASRHPVHVTKRLLPRLPSLREERARRVILGALAGARDRHETRLVVYSIQTNHLHLIVETQDERTLARAMQGLFTRMAKGLNRLWRRRGRVFAERYHGHPLRNPREVRNAIRYVLGNHAHHGIHLVGLDPYASGGWFDGWHEGAPEADPPPHVSPASTWLLRVGWRRWGLLTPSEVERAARGSATLDDRGEPPLSSRAFGRSPQDPRMRALPQPFPPE